MLKVSILGIVVNPWQDNLNVTKASVMQKCSLSENASICSIMICAYVYAYQFVHIYICIYICNQYMYYITKNLKQLPNVNCGHELENT